MSILCVSINRERRGERGEGRGERGEGRGERGEETYLIFKTNIKLREPNIQFQILGSTRGVLQL